MSKGCGLLAASLLSGCASIVSDWEWPVTIDSVPSGAQVLVKDADGASIASGTTPLQVTLDSGDGYFGRGAYTIETTTAAGTTSTATLKSHFNWWYVGNVVFGGLIGFLIVDPLTGAMYRFDDRFVVGAPDTTGCLAPLDGGVQFVRVAELPAGMREHLVPVGR